MHQDTNSDDGRQALPLLSAASLDSFNRMIMKVIRFLGVDACATLGGVNAESAGLGALWLKAHAHTHALQHIVCHSRLEVLARLFDATNGDLLTALGHGEIQLELGRQILLRVQSVAEVHASNAAVGMDLDPHETTVAVNTDTPVHE